MKHTSSLLQLALPLLVSVFLSQAAADCEVAWDKHNVVATQLEGSWAWSELTLIISPSSAGANYNYTELKY